VYSGGRGEAVLRGFNAAFLLGCGPQGAGLRQMMLDCLEPQVKPEGFTVRF
jgi:hypothetical protein